MACPWMNSAYLNCPAIIELSNVRYTYVKLQSMDVY